MLKYTFLFLFFTFHLGGQTNIPKPLVELFDAEKLYNLKSSKPTGQVNLARTKGEYELDIITKEYVNEVYELGVKIPLVPYDVKSAQKLVVQFEARSISSSLETGESKSMWQLKVSNQHTDNQNKAVSFGQEWKKYAVLYVIAKNVQAKDFALVMQFGFPPQHFKIRNISVSLYEANVPYNTLPRTIITYPGMDADAQWRKDAMKRIEQHRRGNIELIVQKNGKPVKDAKIQVNMIQHQFRWGAAARAASLLNNEKEQQLFSKVFNHVVLENDLKMKFWNKTPPKKDVLRCMDQLLAKNISIKGHALIWPGFRHLPDEYKNLKNKKQASDKVNNHLSDILSSTNNKIIRWDVVNEVYSNQDLQKITGSEKILFDAFKFMKEKYPSIKRNVNEFGIISRGGFNKEKQDWYYDFIKRIDAAIPNGVDAIGMQSHIGTDLTPPEKVYAIIDRFASLQKKICISEFTLDIDDPLVRQMYTEDFLIAAFSHPAIDEFLFWGYKGATDSKVDIYDNNGNIGSMGKGYMTLVHGLWKTNYSSTTDKVGSSNGLGFYGKYECSITSGGKTITKYFDHYKDVKTKVVIEL